jgi:cyclophilin family peptidyl-prolyl cis-trans isomerase
MKFHCAPTCSGTIALFGLLSCVIQARSTLAATATDKVRMYFNMGIVEIELYGNESPLHVANFRTYVDAGDYDGSFIHRTRAFNPSQPLGFDLFAQGGSFGPPDQFLNDNPIIPGDPVPNEFDPGNGLSNTPGSLAAARTSDPDSATSGWFINQSNNANSFDPGPFTVFGQVVLGMDIIDQIPFLPNSPNFQGTAFETMPIFNNDLVIIERAVRIPLLTGDYNFDDTVDGGDLTVWNNHFGTTSDLSADGNANGVIDGTDLLIWQATFGPTAAVPNVTTVPEPSTLVLAVMAACLVFRAVRRSDSFVC